jgi:SNF2 family DNA or RNA helicase
LGQQKNVFIYRFICQETIEEKILQLQEYKKIITERVFFKSDNSNAKLELNDLNILFEDM